MPTILAIESSCDDTSAAICKDGKILANIISSQQVHEASQVGAFQQQALRGIYTRYAALLLRENKPEEALVMAESLPRPA